MGSSSYEVLVMQGGKWRIHAQFPASAREDAIDEAKMLESMPGLGGIKVVRDEFDSVSGMHKEHTVFKSKVATPQAASGARYDKYMQRAAQSKMDDMDFGDGALDGGGGGGGGRGSSGTGGGVLSGGMGVVVKLMLVLLFSIAISATLTGILSAFLPYKTLAGIHLYGQVRANVLMVSAIVFFLLSMLVSFKAFMARDQLDIDLPTPGIGRRGRKEVKGRAPSKSRVSSEQREQDIIDARNKRNAEDGLKELKEKQAKKSKKTEEERTIDELTAKEAALEKRKKKKKQNDEDEAPEAEEKPAQEKPVKEEPAPEEKEEKPEPEDDSQLTPAAQAQKTVLMGFFAESIRELPAERKKMDNYNRFGVNLFLAGATEALGGARNLDGQTISEILAESLSVMGLKPEHAAAFANRYEDYLLQDARYMQMFQAGRSTMSSYLGGDKSTVKNLDGHLHEWNKPKAPDDPEKEVVVMFTDIVGSTAMTHEKGNLAAQEVVRAHNQVVRDALAKTHGHEIKHTGDGIMASFEKVTDSLLCAQQMQFLIRLHNEQMPAIPLKVKVGINAGRVVVEESDLYGVTVQMAARIVDKSKEGRVLVSDTVYGMAKGGSWQFVKRGPFFLKGIDGPAFLHELVWDDKADITQIQAEAEAERPKLEQAYAAASGLPPSDQPK
ncbi:MAG: adenylate/guanylate cyclase domain-containing protein [Alphaproteobacteria bacterium]|nr:adenylate/guanylate cyclase domain-containing protein [Alphaproteobacteria bacterium]